MSFERIARAAVSAALLSTALLFLLPSFLYLENAHEISLGFGDFISVAALPVLAATAALTLAILVLARLGVPLASIAGVVAGLGLAVAAKLYFAPSFTPPLEGQEVFAAATSAAGLWSIVSLIALTVAGIWVARRLDLAALVLALIAFVLFGLQPLLSPEIRSAETAVPEPVAAEFFRFSSQGDVLLLLLDTLQSDVFAEVIADDPTLASEFTGFTYFWNTVGKAPTTLMSLLPIYSGQEYDGGSIRGRYADLKQNSLFSDFKNNGYQTELGGVWFFDCPADQCTPSKSLYNERARKSDLLEYIGLIELGAMRVLPTALHHWWYNADRGRLKPFFSAGTSIGHAEGSAAILRALARSLEVTPRPRALKMLHVMGVHPPLSLDQDCKPVPDRSKTRENYKKVVVCVAGLVVGVLKSLKTAGIYDRSTIVIFADHGETLAGDKPQEKILGAVPPLSDRAGRFGPLLAVKLPSASGPLRLSAAPAQISDIRATLCGAVLKCAEARPGENLLALADQAARERSFMDFQLFQRDHKKLDLMPKAAYQRFTVPAHTLLADQAFDFGAVPKRSEFIGAAKPAPGAED